MKLAKEKKNLLKEKTNEFDALLIDNFIHTNNIKARIDFLNNLVSNNLWQLNDPIDFLYTNLYENSLSDKDKSEFFKFIQNKLEIFPSNKLVEKLFNIFTQNICKEQKRCQNLTFQAFESYLKVFLDKNKRNYLLQYNKLAREDKYDITSYCSNPEKLEGFDTLWRIIFESFSNEIMNKGIEILHDLYTVNRILIIIEYNQNY